MMKKISRLMAILGLSGLIGATSIAATPIKVVYNEEMMQLDHEPIMKENRVLLPLRELSEQFGYRVQWNNKDKQIIIYNEETRIKMDLDSKIAYVNNQRIVLDVPAQMIEGVTYIPIRFVIEAFDKEVSWSKDKHKVSIEEGMSYALDVKNKKLIRKEKGSSKVVGDIRLKQEGKVSMKVEDTPHNSQIITIENEYGKDSKTWDRTTFYIKNNEVVKSMQGTYTNYIAQNVEHLEDRVALTDGSKVTIYNDESGKLVKEYDLGRIIGIGNYEVEAVGEKFMLVREQKKGILTLVKLDNQQVVEIYKEILPNEKEKNYVLMGKELRQDGIKFVEKEGNTFHFTYSGLEIENGKFAYYMKK